MTLELSQLSGVGPKIREHLANLDIHSSWDLLFHLPLRYEDRTRLYKIAELQIGDRVLFSGEIISQQLVFGKRPALLVTIADETAKITLRFFHFNASQKKQLAKIGEKIQCFGEVRPSYRGGIEIIHPEYKLSAEPELLEKNLTPIYPVTKGLSQNLMRKITAQALNFLQYEKFPELIPDDLLKKLNFMSLKDALCFVHRPPVDVDVDVLQTNQHPAQQRLIFEELLAQRLAMSQLRAQCRKNAAPAMQINKSDQLHNKLLANLPFQLTAAQVRVLMEITDDLTQAVPMLRLLQGDVGSGKTLVALLSGLVAVANGFQVALMAPTEILAEQHFKNFQAWLSTLNISVAFASSKQKIGSVLEAQFIIGTHALFQEKMEFSNLGLVIVDEQHRFGVHQRLALRNKGAKNASFPHQLIMTATPIPRTLTMTAYADLDVSIIDELPAGRLPIQTITIDDTRRSEIISKVKNYCEKRGQVYWVCALIDESEVLQAQAAENIYADLRAKLSNLKIGLIHGRLKPAEKDAIMQQFKHHEIDLLVATTVIEVGVDVPNASLMVIENAERFGLSQLHQLRGRVGRGSQQSYCTLLYKSPLSANAKKRLEIMRATNDGFKIAREDLLLRGPGEILGTQQAGAVHWRLANILRDEEFIPKVQQFAEEIIEHYPLLISPLVQRWFKGALQYADV